MDDAFDRDWRPKRETNVLIEEVDGETVVLDVGEERIHQLNPTASFVLGLCDGERPVATILKALLEAFEVSEDVAARDLEAILVKMKALGILT